MSHKSSNAAWSAGVLAFSMLITKDQCPYDGLDREAWYDGWDMAATIADPHNPMIGVIPDGCYLN